MVRRFDRNRTFDLGNGSARLARTDYNVLTIVPAMRLTATNAAAQGELVPPNKLQQPIRRAGGPGDHRLVVQIPEHVACETAVS